jgi:hypothetical protein
MLRNSRDLLLDAFDVPDGSGSVPQRNVTTNPTQALTLINGPWMLARAKKLAQRIERETPAADAPSKARIAKLYELTFGRLPNDNELKDSESFVAGDQPDQVLVDFCHVLLNSNEFLYVD